MTTHEVGRVKELFASALDLPAQSRAAFLEDACAGDPALLAELRELLAVDAQLAGMTARPVAAQLSRIVATTAPPAALTGSRVGAFELREELGRGGMGSVYRAERVDGKVTQEVAIKFVRRELLDANTRKRFQLERQLMATLQHPHIARLLDAAELADGTPYYVMEYVRGIPVTDYCARESLNVRECVVLMRRVCAAVAEAHRELIVHRDLKPGNILIGGDATPKLLDFGIAKTLSPLGASAGDDTGTALRYFSVNYAAPEQVTGAPVGIACDIYALGLLLYEVLAGCRPFDFSGLGAAQIERLIIDVPPPAPSTALARTTAIGARERARLLRGDLDGIVLRCLHKSPSERYASVEQLETDLANYLDGLPVRARGGQRWYRAQKFARRNAGALSAAALVGLTLVAGVLGFASQARLADRRAAELRQVVEFQASMLAQVDPTQAGLLLLQNAKTRLEAALAKAGVPEAEIAARVESFVREWQYANPTDVARDLVAGTLLEPAATAIDEQFADQPVVAATLSQVLADRYADLGLFDAALPLQERALSSRKRALGELDSATLESVNGIGALLLRQGKAAEAQAYLRDALEKRRRVLGTEDKHTLQSMTNLGHVLFTLGDFDAAHDIWRQGLEIQRRTLGGDHADTLGSISNVGAVLKAQGKLPDAETYYREALERRRRVLGATHPETLSSINNLGVLLKAQGKLAEAEPYYREALEQRRRVRGEDHPDTITSLNNMGSLLQGQNRLKEAEPYLREALIKQRRVRGEEALYTLMSASNLGRLLQEQGKFAEAAALLIPIEGATRKTFHGDQTNWLTKFLISLGKSRAGLGEFAAAEANLLEAHGICMGAAAPQPDTKPHCTQDVIDFYEAWDRANPGAGYGAKAAQFRQLLVELAGTTSGTHRPPR